MTIPHIRFAFLSLALVLFSLIIPRTAYTKEEYVVNAVGYPTPFIQQSYLSYNPPFPYRYALSSPWEIPMKFLWGNFFLSWVMTFLSLEALWFLIRFYTGRLEVIEKSTSSMILREGDTHRSDL